MLDILESEEDAVNYLENIHNLLEAIITNVFNKATSFQPPNLLLHLLYNKKHLLCMV
jgi:hypothetical protein